MHTTLRRSSLFLLVLLLAISGLSLIWSAGQALAQTKPAGKKPAVAQPAPAAAPAPDSIQKTIDLLQDEAKRREVIKLLKLMAALEDETAVGEAQATTTEQPPADEVNAWLGGLAGGVYRSTLATGAGFHQSWLVIKDVFRALSEPPAMAQWRPYLLKACLWGLVCLLSTLFLLKRYGRPPTVEPEAGLAVRCKAALKYLLVVAGPNMVLILSFLALPPLSTTALGITVDMATGFTFVYALVQHFFINLSALYICLQTITALFTRGSGGRCLVNIHPVLARHFLNTLRVFAIYAVGAAFFRAVFLENFVTGSLYYLIMALLTLPMSIYLSFRVVKLKRLINTIAEAEISAGDLDEESSEETAPAKGGELPLARLDYPANHLFRKHWGSLFLAGIWTLTLIALFNPADIGDQVVGRCLGSLALVGLGVVLIKVERMVLRRVLLRDPHSGRRLLQNLDNLANIVVWGVVTILMVGLWGVPLELVLENELAREVSGRAFAILFTVAALLIFLKFSRLVTAWLLTVPDVNRNRNWRTMTPLLLTAVRTLAIFVAVVVVLERLGVNVGPILAGAGILGLGVGMGAQSLVKDVINGISILLMDTLSVGDYVTIGGKSGTVETVGLRTIRLRDSAGNLTVVPNSSVDTIINMTRDYSQDLVDFAVPYDADPDAMLALAADVAAKLSGDPQWHRQLTAPIMVMGITAFDANGTTIRLKIHTIAGSQWTVGRELRLRLKRRMLQGDLPVLRFGQNVFVYRGESDLPLSDPAGTEPDRPKDR